ncbi:hypothetical protein SRB5_39350 [Streptomyces sp. RB5]|uniref:N-acetyltransferase domain-containing protein n=1 Tax=Streptomyces smaragdinus TaxID=2585196 RepID=A0A7K0CK50_9ACTN|nr:N-acetyltransferase [Streptomyces smaragdinus]MQY13781.1 hypothetical protein [Streptomyces smaragdinus]
MTPATPELVRYGQDRFPEIRPTLVTVYAEVYAEELRTPFHSVERFEERLEGYASRPGWEAVLAYEGSEVTGYAFASTLPAGSRWWSGMLKPMPEEYTAEDGTRTLALFELMVRRPWRGTGLAHRIHEELLTGRPEQRVTLLVDPTHPKVKQLYESWSYTNAGDQRPFPDAPLYATMVRTLGGS